MGDTSVDLLSATSLDSTVDSLVGELPPEHAARATAPAANDPIRPFMKYPQSVPTVPGSEPEAITSPDTRV
jgi:hypothetical protein